VLTNAYYRSASETTTLFMGLMAGHSKKIVIQNECNILVIMVTPNFCFVGPRYFHPVEDKVKTPLLIISSYLALEA